MKVDKICSVLTSSRITFNCCPHNSLTLFLKSSSNVSIVKIGFADEEIFRPSIVRHVSGYERMEEHHFPLDL